MAEPECQNWGGGQQAAAEAEVEGRILDTEVPPGPTPDPPLVKPNHVTVYSCPLGT